jgi:hypothetical protein
VGQLINCFRGLLQGFTEIFNSVGFAEFVHRHLSELHDCKPALHRPRWGQRLQLLQKLDRFGMVGRITAH